MVFRGQQNLAAQLYFVVRSGGKGMVEVANEWVMHMAPPWSISYRWREGGGRRWLTFLAYAWRKKRAREAEVGVGWGH